MPNKNNFSSGLGAILEAPEENNDVDVDMMSQDDEDLVYGSRNSLMAKQDMADSDEDIGGSRNSLKGLKRWSTEENLSLGDPRGSRTELMETPLHDSHSISTGKTPSLYTSR